MLSEIGDAPEFFDQLSQFDTAAQAIDALEKLYAAAIEDLRESFGEYCKTGQRSAPGKTAYPYLLLHIKDEKEHEIQPVGFGNIRGSGWYGTSITSPNVFRGYLTEQLARVEATHDVDYFVGDSLTDIPVAFAIDPAAFSMSKERVKNIGKYFVTPDLKHINDDLADGVLDIPEDVPQPLTLFPALRTDYSLQRLKHYTGTQPEHFQKFVIFTNYQRYVDEFIEHAMDSIGEDGYTGFACPGQTAAGGVVTSREDYNNDPAFKMPQMPAYHLMSDNNEGVTLINIGVGPSNAKTITDHVAVLRSHCWLMLGHCGGLRRTQTLGDFVLAHAYQRDDQVLDDVLPTTIPLPNIAEVQIAIGQAISEVMNLSGSQMKRHVRTGTVVTTGDRNWETRYRQLRTRLNQSRAIAIDMESATIAANGYRLRVPYGTLLCVSDRPLHGEIKLPGTAAEFYRDRVSQHLDIGLRTMAVLKDAARSGSLHSRKLRSQDEPVFR